MTLYYSYTDTWIIISGKTYLHRQAIRDLGGKFMGQEKVWKLPFSPSNLTSVERLCKQFGGGLEGGASEGSLVDDVADDVVEVEKEAIAPVQEEGLRVTELLNLIEGVVQQGFPDMLWVIGEVQNFTKRPGKSVFFQLAEQSGQEASGQTDTISAVIWPGVWKSLEAKLGSDKIGEVLQDGLSVRLLCRVNFYKGRASVSLAVHDLDLNFTKGALALARERLLRELRGKGLDVANKKSCLPLFPFRVGLVSAENSRAESDFLDQLASGKFCGELLYCPASMQGERAPQEVKAAIATLVSRDCDVIVLTRGGGSAADLRWFDTPEIAYAVALCPIPVIAAIGHHDDRCIAEEVCYERQKTPTAAADFILSRFDAVKTQCEQASMFFLRRLDQCLLSLLDKRAFLNEKLARTAQMTFVKQEDRLLHREHEIERKSSRRLSDYQQILSAMAARVPLQARTFLNERVKSLVDLSTKVQWHTELRFERLFNVIAHWEQNVGALDPRPWLAKGWTQLWKDELKVCSIEHTHLEDRLTARLLDGLLTLRVEGKAKKETSS